MNEMITSPRRTLANLLAIVVPALAGAQEASSAIRLNQVGFHDARARRSPVVADTAATAFAVVALPAATRCSRGALVGARARGRPRGRRCGGRTSARLTQGPGRYVLVVPGVGPVGTRSPSADTRAARVARAAVKAFYFQRVSTALPARYAGPWARSAGHPDDSVLVHPSAATAARPAGTRHLRAGRVVRRRRLQQVRRQLRHQHLHAAARSPSTSRRTRRR